MRQSTLLTVSCGIMFTAGTALASQPNVPISNLPSQGPVTVSGTVTRVESAREFRLHDDSGAVDVKLAPDESAVFKQGDHVSVTGSVENRLWGLFGKDIVATNVQVEQSLPKTLSDTIANATGISLSKAKRTNIGQLPKQGLVELTGTVQDVSDAKNFTLKDSTGSIDVHVQSDENVVLANGSKVSVIGYVKDGLLSKQISATRVIVVANAGAAKTGD